MMLWHPRMVGSGVCQHVPQQIPSQRDFILEAGTLKMNPEAQRVNLKAVACPKPETQIV